jgi:hypothetical protein
VIETYLLVSMALPRAAIRRCSSVVVLRTACQRLFDIFLRASTRVDNLDDMHDAICHAVARFRHDASARCFVAHRHNLDVKCRFLRAATPFQLPLFNFYERVSSLPTEADAVNSSTSSVTCTFVAAMDGNADRDRHSSSHRHGTFLRDVGWSQPHM